MPLICIDLRTKLHIFPEPHNNCAHLFFNLFSSPRSASRRIARIHRIIWCISPPTELIQAFSIFSLFSRVYVCSRKNEKKKKKKMWLHDGWNHTLVNRLSEGRDYFRMIAITSLTSLMLMLPSSLTSARFMVSASRVAPRMMLMSTLTSLMLTEPSPLTSPLSQNVPP